MHCLKIWDRKLTIAVSLLFDTVVVLSNFHVPEAKLPNQHLYSGSTVLNSPFKIFFRPKVILTVFRSKDVFPLKVLVRYSKIYIYVPYFGKGLEEPKLTLLLQSSLHIPREKLSHL